MGRKTKYSAKSLNRVEIRITDIQKETLDMLQIICSHRTLPSSQHGVIASALDKYYKELIQEKKTI